jgi:hypothetical protein
MAAPPKEAVVKHSERPVPAASYAQGRNLEKKWRELLESVDANAAEWLIGNFAVVARLARSRPREGLVLHPVSSVGTGIYKIEQLTPRVATLKEANLLIYEPSSDANDDQPEYFPGTYDGAEHVELRLYGFLNHGPHNRWAALKELAAYGLTDQAVFEQMIAFAKAWKPEEWLRRHEPCRIIGLGSTAYKGSGNRMIMPVLLSPGMRHGMSDHDIMRWRLDHIFHDEHGFRNDGVQTWFMTAHPAK